MPSIVQNPERFEGCVASIDISKGLEILTVWLQAAGQTAHTPKHSMLT